MARFLCIIDVLLWKKTAVRLLPVQTDAGLVWKKDTDQFGGNKMALTKCPRCELNYILDGGSLCTVCRREVRGEQTDDEVVEMCSECGENPAVSGSEYCAQCLKEMNRTSASATEDEPMTVEDATIGIDNVSTMDEIVIDDVSAEGAPFDDEEFMDDDDDDDEDEPDEALGGKQRKKRRSQDAELKASGFSVVEGDEAGNALFDR